MSRWRSRATRIMCLGRTADHLIKISWLGSGPVLHCQRADKLSVAFAALLLLEFSTDPSRFVSRLSRGFSWCSRTVLHVLPWGLSSWIISCMCGFTLWCFQFCRSGSHGGLRRRGGLGGLLVYSQPRRHGDIRLLPVPYERRAPL